MRVVKDIGVTIFLSMLALFLSCVSAFAAPTISGTSGAVTHGGSITISGSQFGAKGGTNANKPLIWADFESSINPTSLGHLTAWAGNQNLSRNVAGTQYGNSGANVVGVRSAGVQAFDFQILHTFSSKLYMSGKRRFSSFNTGANFKYFRMWNDAASSILATNLSDGTIYDECCTTQDNRFQGAQPTANVWRMEEYLWRKATNACGASPAVANGYWRMDVNATTQQLHNNQLCSNTTANYGQYLGLSIFDNFDTNENLAVGTNIWMDDFYVDDTWARVVIGNASTLSASTVREMQIPSAWSDTSITVTVNRGSFGASASAWLFVVDANDVVSTGRAITFGSGGGVACTGSSPNLTSVDASYAAVSDCYAAAVDGDTINIPAGSATWASTLVWTNKSITLKGAGIGNTIITADVTGGSYPCLINLTTKSTGGSPAGFTRITGIDFRVGNNCATNTAFTTQAMIEIKGTSQNVRFDHNNVQVGAAAHGVIFNGTAGVADHNTATNASTTDNRHIFVNFASGYGDASWNSASTLGGLGAMYFEDNIFTRGTGNSGTTTATDDYRGARTVYRFNTFNDYYLASHGTETSGRFRGVRQHEHYRNTFNWTRGVFYATFQLRSGTGMAFDNVYNDSGGFTDFMTLQTLRNEDDGSHNSGWDPWMSCGTAHHGQIISMTQTGGLATVTTNSLHYVSANKSLVQISGANESDYNGIKVSTRINTTSFSFPINAAAPASATGTFSYVSPFDGNTDGTGYPCLDQIGRGSGILYSGDGAGSASPTTPQAPANQTLSPVYCWNNILSGVMKGCVVNYGADVIVENRDFYNQNTSFNGTAGIGRGLRSQRSATCTPGVGYWSFDGGGNWNTLGIDGGFDLCTAANTWTNDWYVPLTYPHPLNVPEPGGDTTPPAPPSGLFISKK